MLIHHAGQGTNSYSVIRLAAAFAVIVSHAWAVTRGLSATEPLESLTLYPLGAHAVHVFFILSGFMVTASFERSRSLWHFVRARLLRIYPALIGATLGLFIILGFFLTKSAAANYWSFTHFWAFFLRNMVLLGSGARLEGVFLDNPAAGDVNIPLWTLKYEVACYSLLALSLSLLRWLRDARGRLIFSLSLPMMILVFVLVYHAQPRPYHASFVFDHLVRMGFAFYLGSLAWYLRAFIALSAWRAGALLIMALGVTYAGGPFVEISQIIFLAYMTFWLGHFDFGWLRRFTDRQDYSYGVYIIGFPVQQIMMAFFGPMEPWHNIALSIPVALLWAAASWNALEKPALRFKARSL